MQTVVFGFGSQGRAQALNLKDSGWRPIVFLRKESTRKEEVLKAGLELCTNPEEAAKQAELAVILLPDSQQSDFWKTYLSPHLPQGASLCFAHGFNIHYQQISPRKDLDVILAAPSLQGDGLRRAYEQKETVPMLTAIHQDATDRAYRTAEDLALAIGGPKTHILPTTFKEETETDLFAEQAVLCGGVNALVQAGFETLVNAGYSSEVAYYCCVKELKALAAVLHEQGIGGLRQRISETARYGDITRGPRVIDDHVRKNMKTILQEILGGDFKKELLAEKEKGWPTLQKALTENATSRIEATRKKLDGY